MIDMIEKKYRLNKWGTKLLRNNRPLFDWANESDEIVDLLNSLNDENERLKQQIKDLQGKNDSIEWLRNNTVWEQIPSIVRTSISTNSVENPFDKKK